MNEPTSEASASAEGPSAGTPAATLTEAALRSKELTVQELLEAGVHFGHQTRRWNPRMKPYLFGERNGVHIVDLDHTLPMFNEALEFVREVVAEGGRVLFVGTKRQAQAPVRLEAERAGQFYVNNRWLGGMLTNFKTVKKSIERFTELLETLDNEEKVAELSKKELSRLNRIVDKYRKSLDGIREMSRLPDALFVLDVGREDIAIHEAQRLGIPIVAVVDSNCSPEDIEYVVPGNDDSIRAIQLYCSRVADACLEGDALHQERIKQEVADAERRKQESQKAEPTSPKGRVVVEISQDMASRRPASFGRRDEAPAQPPKAAPAAPEPAPAPATEPAPTPSPDPASGKE